MVQKDVSPPTSVVQSSYCKLLVIVAVLLTVAYLLFSDQSSVWQTSVGGTPPDILFQSSYIHALDFDYR